MSEQPVGAISLSGFRLNLRIFSVVMFNFASYMTIGLPLAVLPGYVHDVMGYSAFWAGLVISLQYFTTLLSRPHAGRYADLWGPKKVVIVGLCGCFISGICYLLAALNSGLPLLSLLLLCAGRLILGVGQSFAGTGSTLWGVGVVGSLHIGRVISWNGIFTYGAMAIGAPLGVAIYHWGGLMLLAGIITAIALVGILLALPRAPVKSNKGKPLPFRAVLGRIWSFGLLLAMGSVGFGVIATFITLFYQDKGWDGAAFALNVVQRGLCMYPATVPQCHCPPRRAECGAGLFCGGSHRPVYGLGAWDPWLARVGALLTGAGFSLVFPAIGVVAVKVVPPQNQGSALATYTAFMDLALGITGPLAGLVMSYAVCRLSIC